MRALMVAEFRKLAMMPVLAGFLALSLLFNALIVAGSSYLVQYVRSAAGVTRSFGGCIDETMREAFAAGATEEDRALLGDAVATAENIFEGMDTAELSAHYTAPLGPSSLAALIERKYQALQARVDHLAATGAALDLYAGPYTHDVHQLLFGRLMPAVIGEGALAGIAVALLLQEVERMAGTRQMLFSSAIGRRIMPVKLACAAAVGFACYVLLAAATLGGAVFFLGAGDLMGANVSSQFNFLVEGNLIKPFMTWGDFTVAGYLLATCALGAALVLMAVVAASAWGTLFRDAYRTALALAAACVSMPVISDMAARMGAWEMYAAASFLPVNVWLRAWAWFTDQGRFSFIPWHEAVAVGVGLVGVAAMAGWSYRRFSRRDVVV